MKSINRFATDTEHLHHKVYRMANTNEYTRSEWNWYRRKKCSISFFLFAFALCVDSAVPLVGDECAVCVHNGAKYGFSISEQRNRNTWLHYPMGLPHRRFNKRSKYT